MDIPASLQHRIDLFRETGRVFRVPNELFAENSWIQVMLGQGIMPQQHHPVADLMGDEELSRFLERHQARRSTSTVMQLPKHQAYVEQYCKAPDLRAAESAGEACDRRTCTKSRSWRTYRWRRSRASSTPARSVKRKDAAESAVGDVRSSATGRIPSRSRWRPALPTASACWSRSCTARSTARC